MDRPDDIICYRCGTVVGMAVGEHFVWTCPGCNAQVEWAEHGGTQAARERTIQLTRDLERLDAQYQRDIEQFKIVIGGSKVMPGVPFTPDRVGFQPAGVAMMVGAIGLFFIYLRLWILGVAALAGAYGVYRLLRTTLDRKLAGYERVTREWEHRRAALLRALYEGSARSE